MDILVSVIAFVLLLGVLIFVHELGHFMVAKWCGMRVDQFSIGFAPHIFRKTKGETEYVIGVVPFGGYVKIRGENSEEEFSDDPRSFERKPVWQRISVILAGITMNVLFAFVVLSVAFSVGFSSFAQDLTKEPGATVVTSRVIIVQVAEDAPAKAAGIRTGDLLKNVSTLDASESYPIFTTQDLQEKTKGFQEAGIRRIALDIEREGEPLRVESDLSLPGSPALGVLIQPYNAVRVPFYRAPIVAAKEMTAIIQVTWSALADFGSRLFTKAQLDPNVSGPLGIYQATSVATKMGFEQVVFLSVALSLNLALLNILPIPALDGGRFVFLLSEAIFRRRVVAQKIEQAVTAASFFALMLLFVVLTVRDVFKFF